jgi:hypothetical protein
MMPGPADAQTTQLAPAAPKATPKAAPATAAPIAPTPAAPPAPTTRPGDRSAEEMLRQMLQPQGEGARPLRPAPEAAPAVDATSGDAAVAPFATPQAVLREGTLLLDRVGRLTRAQDGGGFELTLDSDGRALADAPLRLLANRSLMQLEDRVQSSYRDLRLRVSGEVTEYRGRNYLLLQRWSAVPDVAEPLR